MKKNYYEILEISPNASPEIIEKAYKTLTRKYHPDVQTKENKKDAEDKFKEIVKAYETLSDPDKKEEYDEYQKLKGQVESTVPKEETSEKRYIEKRNKYTVSYFQTCLKSIGTVIYNHSKKSKSERSKDIKALAISFGFMIVLILIIWKVPFVNNFFFP